MNYINNSKKSIDSVNIAVAPGDGIGLEIMEATLKLLKEADARLKYEFVEVGEKFYQRGYESGISDEAWKTIRRNKVLFKGPITTPQGAGYKSINVTLRKYLGLYANVRPCMSYFPFISTKFEKLDVVIIRENEEDLYAGIEYQQTQDAVNCIKIITKKGCERIIKYAFEYAVKNNRKKVTCMTKNNIMKMTDGLFYKTFEEIAKNYPDIESDHYIIDIGSARLATVPEQFDVVVTLNLYGDIISDIVAELTGSVGLSGSANIGEKYAMFEAIHGSAPVIAGQGIANPCALMNSAVQMLSHIGQGDVASKIEKAVLKTIESGIHTVDIFDSKISKRKVNTNEFTDAVIQNLGQEPDQLKSRNFSNFTFDYKSDDEMLGLAKEKDFVQNNKEKELIGVDLFIDKACNAEKLGRVVDEILQNTKFALKIISSRGCKVYPGEFAKYSVSDMWCARIIKIDESFTKQDVIFLLSEMEINNIDIVKTENLYDFDKKRAYSVAQGE